MEMFYLISIFIILQIISPSDLLHVDCLYSNHHYDVMGSIYQCKVEGYFAITSKETATIDSVSRSHSQFYNNNNVKGFVADHKSLEYFPQGLDKHFNNIQLLRIRFTHIKEVNQSDFKPFSELKELDMHENKITILEDGLFDFNPKLVFVSFSSNKIFRIETKVFNGLSNLMYLYLSNNQCIDTFANNNRDIVEMVIAETKTKCSAKEEPSTEAPDAITHDNTTAQNSGDYEEDLNYDEDFTPRPSYRTSGSRSSSLQIMFIIIFLLAITAAGGVFYFLYSYGYRF